MRRLLLITFTLLVAAAAVGQQNKPAARNDFSWAHAPYRLDYVIREMDDGKVVNSRNYSMVMTSTDERGRGLGDMRAGSRIPVNVGDKGIQYVDVGVNINSRLYVLDSGALLLDNNTEISTLATPEGQGANPIIRQIRSSTTSEVIVGKASQIALLDDPVSKRRFQIEVTPTKLK